MCDSGATSSKAGRQAGRWTSSSCVPALIGWGLQKVHGKCMLLKTMHKFQFFLQQNKLTPLIPFSMNFFGSTLVSECLFGVVYLGQKDKARRLKSRRTDLYMTNHNEMGASCYGGINRGHGTRQKAWRTLPWRLEGFLAEVAFKLSLGKRDWDSGRQGR